MVGVGDVEAASGGEAVSRRAVVTGRRGWGRRGLVVVVVGLVMVVVVVVAVGVGVGLKARGKGS